MEDRGKLCPRDLCVSSVCIFEKLAVMQIRNNFCFFLDCNFFMFCQLGNGDFVPQKTVRVLMQACCLWSLDR
jgi:hypothetical protein